MDPATNADLNDAGLVHRTRSGDQEAYGELVARYQGHVYGLAYSLVSNWSDAQDIAQEAFIRAYSNLEQLRDPARFAAWLRRVTFSVAMNWIKAYHPELFRQLGSPEDVEHLGIPDFAPGPAEEVEKRELAAAVMQAVASLPSKYRVPLTMFHLDGLSYQKVADFLDIPLGTVKSLIHHAKQQLRPALGAYAAGELGNAVEEVFAEHKLPAEFVSKVLEGVDQLRWGQGQECTFMGALAAALRAMDEEVTYDELMGLSGAAFRLQFHQPNWDNSSADVLTGFDHAGAALAALGYRAEWYRVDEDDAAGVRNARGAIMRSIDQGHPVVAQKLRVAMDWGVITGYREEGKEFLGRTYWDQTEEYARADNWPWRVLIFGNRVGVPDRAEAILRSLEIAVELATTSRFGDYASGFAAYERWVADVLDDDRFESADTEQLERMACCNGWCYFSLEDARRVAARYLRSIEEELGEQSRSHLVRAAEAYDQLLTGLSERLTHVYNGDNRTNGEPWTQEIRQAQAETLRAAMALERTAVDELRAILAQVGR